MKRGLILALGLGVCFTSTTACGDGGAEARSGRLPDPRVTTTAPATSGRVVTSWKEQQRLPYHFDKRPEVFYQRYSPDSARNAGYIVTARLSRRLQRVPKKDRDDPLQGGPDGPTKGTVLLNGHGGGISPGLGTVSYKQPCYEKTFDSDDGRGNPPLFPPRSGKLVTVTLRVPGHRRIAVRVRARHYTKPRYQAALKRLGCET